MHVPVRLRFAALAAAALAVSAGPAGAEILTFDLVLDDTNYLEGETVNWQVFVTPSDFNAGYLGIGTAEFDLDESRDEALSPGAVTAPFSAYTFTSGGTVNGPGNLTAVFAGQLAYDPAVVTGTSAGTPLSLATGSFTARTVGAHDLTLSALLGSNSFYQTQPAGGQLLVVFDAVVGDTESFTVSAVPEPATAALLGLVAAFGGLGAVRRRRAAPA